MPLKKICNRNGCNTLVDFGQRYCSEHVQEYEQKQKERHLEYKKFRNDKKEQAFYVCDEWIKTRDYIKGKYKGLCLYSLYVLNKIEFCDVVHHIVELKDNWELRLDESNLIPMCDGVHNQVHVWYRDRKEEVQELLRKLKRRWEEDRH